MHPDDLAYVIFTSGSTGKPKGAMIEHAGMLNHLLAKQEAFEITPASVIAQNASHCFDISVWQFFAALLAGGTTMIYEDGLVLDPLQFLAGVERDSVTILEVVPSYLAALLPRLEERPAAVSRLQYLAVTGEVVKPQLVEAWFRLFPAIPVVNAYGPTEAADDIAHCKMLAAPAASSIPLGRPIRNTHIYIVEASGNLCPVESKGEICVSGAGVGRGYLNDPEKTKLAFCEDPFRPEKGVRMYRTGDLGCWMADGNILLFGRKDHQVKIRGHRIELGEVEAALHALDAVAGAVVLDRTDDGREPYLCAYVVPKAGHATDVGEVTERLAAKLPDYMIPSFFVWMDQLPLTPNGKIDRKAFPAPERSLEARKAGYAAPRTPTEAALCTIWGEALRIPSPGIHADFFALGGDSIIAMQIVARASKAGLKLLPKQVLQFPTIAHLARAATPAPATVENEPAPGPAVLTPIQRRFFEQKKADPHYYNQSVVLEVPASLDPDLVRRAIDAAVWKHEALRLRFQERGGDWTPELALDAPAIFAVYDLPEAEFDAAAEGLHRSLSLTEGPLLRAGLFRFGPDRPARLLFVAHHLVIDGVSWRIL
ncbi:MAG: AMP-binding protein, partial [Bryobacteraceae bacterium]